MKRLILVRHAKSSWSNADLPDRERPLNERGSQAALKIGDWLAQQNMIPAQVMCSTAIRCRQTWDGLSVGLKTEIDPQFEPGLYSAGPPDLLGYVQKATAETVLLISHMPGIGEFARVLRRDPPPLHEMFQKYPAGAVTVLDFNVENWSTVQMGTGKHVAYITPKEM